MSRARSKTLIVPDLPELEEIPVQEEVPTTEFFLGFEDDDELIPINEDEISEMVRLDQVQAMIDRAVERALAMQVLNTTVAPAPAVEQAPPPVKEAKEPFIPVPYYNPKIIDEQFYVIGSPYRQRFVKGRFVAKSAAEEQSVRACLAAHGREAPDRWRGEDRREEWVCRITGFRTLNENAKYDYEKFHDR